jgi:mRNA (2'-O-methyladenosine-N6-)-methyltransferase
MFPIPRNGTWLIGRFQVIVADPPWDIHMSVCPLLSSSPFLPFPLLPFFRTPHTSANQAQTTRTDSNKQLPYGTMTDDEMRQMPIPSLQPDWGILCLWVTGRAMELGRELFQQWGYRRVDELVWVKTSQLGRLIRTGRTGHWLKWVPPLLVVSPFPSFCSSPSF